VKKNALLLQRIFFARRFVMLRADRKKFASVTARH